MARRLYQRVSGCLEKEPGLVVFSWIGELFSLRSTTILIQLQLHKLIPW